MARHPDIDHGYAWIIMLATFGLQYLQSSIYISFSVLLVEFSDIFDIPKYEAALAGSISMGTTCLSGENNQNRAVIIRGGGGGYSPWKWAGVCLRHVQNLILSQFASRLKRHPVPILKLTLNLINWLMV